MGFVIILVFSIIAMFLAVFCGIINGIDKENREIYLGEKHNKNF